MIHTRLLPATVLIGDQFEVVVASLGDIISSCEWAPHMVGGDEFDAPELFRYGAQMIPICSWKLLHPVDGQAISYSASFSG